MTLAAELDRRGADAGPAIFYADQSKAFEPMSHAWMDQVMARWGFPRWLRRALMALTKGRKVRAGVMGGVGPARTLLRSLGMGGPASPFCWNMAYDPIVEYVAKSLGIDCPTFVDDLAANCKRVGQTLLAQLLLIAAGRAAGLLTETHECAWVMLDSIRPEAAAALAHLGADVQEGDGIVIKGLPPRSCSGSWMPLFPTAGRRGEGSAVSLADAGSNLLSSPGASMADGETSLSSHPTGRDRCRKSGRTSESQWCPPIAAMTPSSSCGYKQNGLRPASGTAPFKR